LLADAGFSQVQAPAAVDEHWPAAASPEEGTVELAQRKARAVAALYRDKPVLGADTVVVLDDQILGKPVSEVAAKEMLLKLSGQTHRVVTGVALVRSDQVWSGFEVSRVTFKVIQPAQIDDYLSRADFLDKAGAYGIQDEGQELVEGYEGELDTIIGLPIKLVLDLWQQMEAHDV
jgi:septum formation protein